MNDAHRNLKYLPWFSALRAFDALLPFYVLYARQCGLSYFDIFITQIVFSISILLFDVPLGIYSDLYGRKKSILLGGIASCIGYGFLVLWPAFGGFVCGEIAIALSYAAFSGADTALLFETTKKLKQEESYCEQEGIYQAFARYAEGLSSILGGLFASISLALPAILTWLLSFPRLCITLLLHEASIKGKTTFAAILKHRIRDQLKAIRNASKHPTILWILLYSGLLSAMIINTFWLLQVFLKTYQVNYFLIGVLCFVYHSTTGYVARHTSKILERTQAIEWILPLLFQAMVIILGMTHSAWFFPAFLISSIVFGIKMPFIYNNLHRKVDDNVRASILSLDSFSTRLLFSILALPIGWILDHISLNIAFLFLTIPNLLVLIIAKRICA